MLSRPCQSCEMLSINGVACHETGCPDAWIGRPTKCWECGLDFVPDERPNRYSVCPECANPQPFEDDSNCAKCHSGTRVADTCDTCNERHCPACSPCEDS